MLWSTQIVIKYVRYKISRLSTNSCKYISGFLKVGQMAPLGGRYRNLGGLNFTLDMLELMKKSKKKVIGVFMVVLKLILNIMKYFSKLRGL